MTNQPFLYIDDEPVYREQVFGYLKAIGQLEKFIEDILSQHAIAKEFENNPDLLTAPDSFDAVLEEYRQQENLTDDEVFEAWLQQNELDAETLTIKLLERRTMEQLIQAISQPKLQEHFLNRKEQLDQVCLSCLVVESETTANELKEQIIKEMASFEELAQAHSLADNRHQGGIMPPIARADLTHQLLAEITAAAPSQLIGPLEINNQWCLLRLDKILPAALDSDTKNQLQIELFQQWLADRINAMAVKMEVTEWLYL